MIRMMNVFMLLACVHLHALQSYTCMCLALVYELLHNCMHAIHGPFKSEDMHVAELPAIFLASQCFMKEDQFKNLYKLLLDGCMHGYNTFRDTFITLGGVYIILYTFGWRGIHFY